MHDAPCNTNTKTSRIPRRGELSKTIIVHDTTTRNTRFAGPWTLGFRVAQVLGNPCPCKLHLFERQLHGCCPVELHDSQTRSCIAG